MNKRLLYIIKILLKIKLVEKNSQNIHCGGIF